MRGEVYKGELERGELELGETVQGRLCRGDCAGEAVQGRLCREAVINGRGCQSASWSPSPPPTHQQLLCSPKGLAQVHIDGGGLQPCPPPTEPMLEGEVEGILPPEVLCAKLLCWHRGQGSPVLALALTQKGAHGSQCRGSGVQRGRGAALPELRKGRGSLNCRRCVLLHGGKCASRVWWAV